MLVHNSPARAALAWFNPQTGNVTFVGDGQPLQVSAGPRQKHNLFSAHIVWMSSIVETGVKNVEKGTALTEIRGFSSALILELLSRQWRSR